MSDSHTPAGEGKDRAAQTVARPAWIGGAVLILIGIIFLVRAASGLALANWWALFILIPALGSLATAWRMYRRADGKLTPASVGPLIGGVALVTVTAIFLFNLDWGRVWPVFLIIAGLSALLGGLARR